MKEDKNEMEENGTAKAKTKVPIVKYRTPSNPNFASPFTKEKILMCFFGRQYHYCQYNIRYDSGSILRIE